MRSAEDDPGWGCAAFGSRLKYHLDRLDAVAGQTTSGASELTGAQMEGSACYFRSDVPTGSDHCPRNVDVENLLRYKRSRQQDPKQRQRAGWAVLAGRSKRRVRTIEALAGSMCLDWGSLGSCSGRNTVGMRVLMARFLNHMVAEDVQVFWAELQRGEFITDAAAAAGTYRKQGTRWVIANGGVRPRRGRNLTGRFLSFAERDEIALGRAAGESMREIARRLGRSPATISRELRRNALAPGRYRATNAHAAAWVRASRPKPAKLTTNLVLRKLVEKYLKAKYSPEQIAGRLRVKFPDDPEMWCRPKPFTSHCMSSPAVRCGGS